MTNDQNSDNPPGKPNTDPLPESATLPVQPQNAVGTDPQARTSGNQDTPSELAREFRWVEWSQVIINGVLAVIGIIALCIYHGQLKVMQGQLGEIIKQYPELKKSADAAENAATAATETFQQQQKMFIADQRPYVVAEDFTLHSNIGYKTITQPTVGEGFSVEIHFRNVGKTPALKAMFHCHLVSDIKTIKAEPLEKDRSDSQIIPQGGWVPRGAVHIENTYAGEENTKKPLSVPYKTGAIFAFGRVTYYDSAGNIYCTPYLESLGPTGEWKYVRAIGNAPGRIAVRNTDLCAGIPPY